MTQDEIIEMAQECGLVGMRPHLDGIYIESLLAFAKLVADKALAEHAMQEVQRLGQEIEPDDIASILACRDMLDAQPVPPRRKPLTDEQIFALENSIPDEIVSDRDWCIYFARAIEAAHGIKEKNT